MSITDLLAASRIPEDLADAYSVAVRRYGPRPDIVGVAIGPKVSGDEVDWNSLAIQIRVEEKRTVEAIAEKERIPAMIGGIATDILEGPGLADPYRPTTALPGRTDAAEVLAPGLSIGVPNGAPGTLGMFVQHPQAGMCLLSADHVLAPRGHGDDPRVYHPAPDDAPAGGRGHIAIVYKRLPANGVSIARLETSLPTSPVPLGAPGALRGVRLPRLGDVLEKSGRTTEVTRAKVVRFGAFRNCKPGIELQPVDGSRSAEISMGGDSGAVWYDPETLEAVAVHCRGDGDGDARQEWAQAVILAEVMGSLRIATVE